MKTLLLILLLQPVRIAYYYFNDDHKAINMLHAQGAIYDESESNAIVLKDENDTLVIKYAMNEFNEIIPITKPMYFRLRVAR